MMLALWGENHNSLTPPYLYIGDKILVKFFEDTCDKSACFAKTNIGQDIIAELKAAKQLRFESQAKQFGQQKLVLPLDAHGLFEVLQNPVQGPEYGFLEKNIHDAIKRFIEIVK